MLIYWVTGWELPLENDTDRRKRDTEDRRKSGKGTGASCAVAGTFIDTQHFEITGPGVRTCENREGPKCKEQSFLHMPHIPTVSILVHS